MRVAPDLPRLIADYAVTHRDERNIAGHFVGVPMIVFALADLLARPSFTLAGQGLTPAAVLALVATVWYLSRGNVALGAVVGAGIGLLTFAAHGLAHRSTASWLAGGLGVLGLGWLIRSVGQWYEGYEGRKPGMLHPGLALWVAPLFVAAEAMFLLGWNAPLRAEIERRAGPTVLRDLARIA